MNVSVFVWISDDGIYPGSTMIVDIEYNDSIITQPTALIKLEFDDSFMFEVNSFVEIHFNENYCIVFPEHTINHNCFDS